MIKVSPYTPLNFSKENGKVLSDGYCQVFAKTDHILIQAFDAEGSKVIVYDETNGTKFAEYEFSEYRINEDVTVYYCEISQLPTNIYSVEVTGYGQCSPFKVTDEEDALKDTVLIQYSQSDNTSTEEAVFLLGNEIQFFDFRAYGGFKASDCELTVVTEQFETQDNDIVLLDAADSLIITLTIGNSHGYPIWIGELLNKIISCKELYLNGERYKQTAAGIEKEDTHEKTDLFVYKSKVTRSTHLDPASEVGIKKIILRGVEEEEFRHTEQQIPRLVRR